jgi:hypothetical protein
MPFSNSGTGRNFRLGISGYPGKGMAVLVFCDGNKVIKPVYQPPFVTVV